MTCVTRMGPASFGFFALEPAQALSNRFVFSGVWRGIGEVGLVMADCRFGVFALPCNLTKPVKYLELIRMVLVECFVITLGLVEPSHSEVGNSAVEQRDFVFRLNRQRAIKQCDSRIEVLAH